MTTRIYELRANLSAYCSIAKDCPSPRFLSLTLYLSLSLSLYIYIYIYISCLPLIKIRTIALQLSSCTLDICKNLYNKA